MFQSKHITFVHTRSHVATVHSKSIIRLRSLQSNSFRQKSLKQSWFWTSCYPLSVSSLFNSHQPLLLPKITQERHSKPYLTTAQRSRKRRIKTHTKKETHHIVEGGEKEHSYSSMVEDIYWWFWQRRNHTQASECQERQQENLFKDVCLCNSVFRKKKTTGAYIKHRHGYLTGYSDTFA